MFSVFLHSSNNLQEGKKVYRKIDINARRSSPIVGMSWVRQKGLQHQRRVVCKFEPFENRLGLQLANQNNRRLPISTIPPIVPALPTKWWFDWTTLPRHAVLVGATLYTTNTMHHSLANNSNGMLLQLDNITNNMLCSLEQHYQHNGSFQWFKQHHLHNGSWNCIKTSNHM